MCDQSAEQQRDAPQMSGDTSEVRGVVMAATRARLGRGHPGNQSRAFLCHSIIST